MTATRPDAAYAKILTAIEEHGRRADTGIAGLGGEIKGLGKEIGRLRDDINSLGGRVTVLEHEDAAGAPAIAKAEREIEEGLPFRKGWARTLGLAAIGLGIAGGLKGALTSLIEVGGALVGAFTEFAHLLLPPPH